jgi:hypothetical protein
MVQSSIEVAALRFIETAAQANTRNVVFQAVKPICQIRGGGVF